jgi:hypothetical protein
VDPAQRPLTEAGEGVAEGFELAEEELIEPAQHDGTGADPPRDPFTPEVDHGQTIGNTAKQSTRIPPRSVTPTAGV